MLKIHVGILYALIAGLTGWAVTKQQSLEQSIKYKGFVIDSLQGKLAQQEQWIGKLIEVSKNLDASGKSNSTSVEAIQKRVEKLETRAEPVIFENVPAPDMSAYKAPRRLPVLDTTAEEIEAINRRVKDLETEQYQQAVDAYEAKRKADHDKLMKGILKR